MVGEEVAEEFGAAIHWAESVLGCPVRRRSTLTGGQTSVMLGLSDAYGRRSVLRLISREPWRTHGAALTRRERAAQMELSATAVPAPTSLGLDADGLRAGFPAHLMSRMPGRPTSSVDETALRAMARMLATIHEVRPAERFRPYQSWAWEAKWVVPAWTRRPDRWRAAFDLLAEEPPPYAPTFLHRDFSHRNLLWRDGAISGVVDWVETSTGPAWLDAGHAATNLALARGTEPAAAFLAAYGALTASRPDLYWLVMDAVGFLPPPGREPMFGSSVELARLDDWLNHLFRRPGR